jgi:hypothetical protein
MKMAIPAIDDDSGASSKLHMSVLLHALSDPGLFGESVTKNAVGFETKPKFRFLRDFPPELRTEVYKYALVFDGTLRRLWHKGSKPTVDISLMLTNGTVYAEAFETFYRHNTFGIPYLAFSSNVNPDLNAWLPRNPRPSERQLNLMRRIELYQTMGGLNVFHLDISHLQEAWGHRNDIKFLSFTGFLFFQGYYPDGFDELLESTRTRLKSFFTFRNVACVKITLSIKERDMPSQFSDDELCKCWKDWATYTKSMCQIMEAPREPPRASE